MKQNKNPLLIYYVRGDYHSETLQIIEYRERLRVIDKEKFNVDYFDKATLKDLAKSTPSFHLIEVPSSVRQEAFRKIPYDYIYVTAHGGFKWEFSYQSIGKTYVEQKNSYLNITDKEQIKKIQDVGADQFQLENNKEEYKGVLQWREELKTKLEHFSNDDAISGEIEQKLLEVEKWVGAFTKWFLDGGHELPIEIYNTSTKLTESTNNEVKIDNVFRENGDFWEVSFEGVEIAPIKNLKGMKYIARLLAVPYKDIHCNDLLPHEGKKMDIEQIEEERLTVQKMDKPTKLGDPKAIADVEKELKKVLKEKEIAKESETPENALTIIECDDEIGKLTKCLLEYKGKPKMSAGDKKKATSVAKAINDSIESIRQYNVELADHLEKYIITGNNCRYKPPEETFWITT